MLRGVVAREASEVAARAQIAPVAPTCLQALAGMLLEVCKNPTQPGFNHFLFESVAALVRFTAAAGGGGGGAAAGAAAGVEALEQQLFPAFQLVLQQDVQARRPRRRPPRRAPTCARRGHARVTPHLPARVGVEDRALLGVRHGNRACVNITSRGRILKEGRTTKNHKCTCKRDNAWRLARAPPARAPRRSSTRTCSRSLRS